MLTQVGKDWRFRRSQDAVWQEVKLANSFWILAISYCGTTVTVWELRVLNII